MFNKRYVAGIRHVVCVVGCWAIPSNRPGEVEHPALIARRWLFDSWRLGLWEDDGVSLVDVPRLKGAKGRGAASKTVETAQAKVCKLGSVSRSLSCTRRGLWWLGWDPRGEINLPVARRQCLHTFDTRL